jgi:NAD(P)-dependent dehydrogenase (short-subunit alcohol dehydrogenase family)
VALVTGAQQGIGKAIALAYGREGASVVVNFLDDQAAAEAIAAPEDIADVAVFLASEEARHITGQTLHVNGGQYLA